MNEPALSTNIEIGTLAKPFEVEQGEERCMKIGLSRYELTMPTVLAQERSASYLH